MNTKVPQTKVFNKSILNFVNANICLSWDDFLATLRETTVKEQEVAISQAIASYYLFSRASPLEHQCLRKAYPRLGNMDLKEDDCSDK